MTRLRTLFESGPWTDLRPAQHLLAEQPGEDDPRHFIAVAQTPDTAWTVAYAAHGGDISLKQVSISGDARWHNPRTGGEVRADVIIAEDGRVRFHAPDEHDWMLSIRQSRP
jgi:hypothetical protein